MCKRVVESAVAVDGDADYSLAAFGMLLLQLHAPYQPLGVEVEHLGQTKHQVLELSVDELLVDPYELVQELFVLDKERRHRLELSILRRRFADMRLQEFLDVVLLLLIFLLNWGGFALLESGNHFFITSLFLAFLNGRHHRGFLLEYIFEAVFRQSK